MWKKNGVKSLSLCSPETSSAETNAVVLTLIASSVSSCGGFGTAIFLLGIIKPWAEVGVKWCSQVSACRGSGAGSSPGSSEDRGEEEGTTAPLVEGQIWLLRLSIPPPSSPWLALCSAFRERECLASIQPSLLAAATLTSACPAEGRGATPTYTWVRHPARLCQQVWVLWRALKFSLTCFRAGQNFKIQKWEKGSKTLILHFLFVSNETPSCSTEFLTEKALRDKTLIISLSLKIPKPQILRTAFSGERAGRMLFWGRKEKGGGRAGIVGCQCCPFCMFFIIHFKYAKRYPNGISPVSSWMQRML